MAWYVYAKKIPMVTPGILVSHDTLSVTEGMSATYTVKLSIAPTVGG